jgi:hypothetical protein
MTIPIPPTTTARRSPILTTTLSSSPCTFPRLELQAPSRAYFYQILEPIPAAEQITCARRQQRRIRPRPQFQLRFHLKSDPVERSAAAVCGCEPPPGGPVADPVSAAISRDHCGLSKASAIRGTSLGGRARGGDRNFKCHRYQRSVLQPWLHRWPFPSLRVFRPSGRRTPQERNSGSQVENRCRRAGDCRRGRTDQLPQPPRAGSSAFLRRNRWRSRRAAKCSRRRSPLPRT